MQPGWIQDAEIGRAPGLQGRQRKGVIGMSEQEWKDTELWLQRAFRDGDLRGGASYEAVRSRACLCKEKRCGDEEGRERYV